MKRFISAIALAALIGGCTLLPKIEMNDQTRPRIIASEKRKELRKAEAKKYSLTEKVEILENRLQDFMHPPYTLISEFKLEGEKGPAHTEHSLHFLAYLSSKYAVTQEEGIQKVARSNIESIIKLDESNGFDGFLPLQSRLISGKLQPVDEKTHSNVYTQLFFSYIRAHKRFTDPQIKKLIEDHLTTIASHFLQNNYQLVDYNAKTMDYSDLSITPFNFRRNRALCSTLLTVVGLEFVDAQKNPQLYGELKEKKKLLDMYGYPDKGLLHLRFLNQEFPTSSSSWLNLIALDALYSLTKDAQYPKMIETLHRKTEDSANIFFDIIYLDNVQNMSEEKREKIEQRINFYLESFPLTINSAEIINSHRTDIEIRSPRYVKFKSEPEVLTPLPIYERSGDSYEWIRNQHRLDRGHGDGHFKYTGLDFLQTYWMFQEYLINHKQN